MATTTARKRERRAAKGGGLAVPSAKDLAAVELDRRRRDLLKRTRQETAEAGGDPDVAEANLRAVWLKRDAANRERRQQGARRERDRALGLVREDGVEVSRRGGDGATPEREAQQLEGVAAIEPARAGRPARARDILDAWEASGAITRAAAAAARQFRDDFQAAGLLRLRAVDFGRTGGGGSALDLPGGTIERERIYRTLKRLGGWQSSVAVVLWHLVGSEETFAEVALRMPGPMSWSVDQTRGIAIGAIEALGALASS